MIRSAIINDEDNLYLNRMRLGNPEKSSVAIPSPQWDVPHRKPYINGAYRVAPGRKV